mgnify:CR=1 FL=1
MGNSLLYEHVELPDSIKELKSVTNKDGSRYYETPDGSRYPSVTTVTGWEKRQFFAEWRRKNPKESARVLSVGNGFHKVVEDYLNNEEYRKNAKQSALNLFDYVKPLLRNIGKIHAQEVPLWSNMLRLAGRVDCVAEYKGKMSIIDFKSSRREKKEEYIDNYFAQATAYSIMWQELTGVKIDQIVILISCEDGSIQEFIEKPINHVKRLKEMIDYYWECN